MIIKDKTTLVISDLRPFRLARGYWINTTDNSVWYQNGNGDWEASAYTYAELMQIAASSPHWTIVNKVLTPTPDTYGAF